MIDLFENPFGPPVKRAAPADPFGTMPFEDRWHLASEKILATNLGRRLLGLPDRTPGSGTDIPLRQPVETASGSFAGSYEAIPGWRVPLDADLKDLGLAALDNARRAEEAPSPARQVRAAARLRRAVGSPQAGDNPAVEGQTTRKSLRRASPLVRPPAPQPRRSGRPATGTQGVFGIDRSAGPPKAKPGTADARQRQTEERSRPPLAGPAAGLFPAHWRALAGGLLQAREAIKQASIGAERKHGDDRQAHDADVAAVARQEDARLPGFTEHATVLSALRAGEKYRQNVERRPPPTSERSEAAPGRTTVNTLVREASHALGKAEKALDAGERRAAEGHQRDALLFLTNAKAAEIDALKAGIARAKEPASDPDADDERGASERNAGGKDSAVVPPPEGAPAKGPAPAKEDNSAGSQKPDRTAERPTDREAPAKFDRKDAIARLERQFVFGPAPLDADVNWRIIAAVAARHASAEARDAAVGNAIQHAWRHGPDKQRKLTAAAKAAAAGKTAAERKRLFLEAVAGTTVERTLEEFRKAENSRVSRINGERATAAFAAWRRANPDASEPERLNRAVDLALAYGAPPDALKTTVLRHIAQKRGVQRDRHGKMTVADAEATWKVYAALGRLYRRDAALAKDLFPGIHGFVAESVAQNRFGWNAAESDPAARTAILKAIYSDAQKRSFRKHEHGLHALPIVGNILAAPQTAEDIGNVFRRARNGDAGGALESLIQAALGVGLPAGRAAGKSAGGLKKRPIDPRTAQGTPDPDLHGAGIDWSGRESTQRFFREVYRNKRRRARFGRKVPTVGAPEYKGQPVRVGGGRPDVLVGEARLHWDGKRAYALNLQGERVYIDRLPRNAVRTKDGGWLVTRRLDDGSKVTVYYNPYGVPEFPARGAFWLPPEVVAKGGKAHKDHVMKQLREMAQSNPDELLRMKFSLEQIEKMKQNVDLRALGIQIHHDYRVGRMLIVDERFHMLAHKGGRSLW